MVTQHTRGFVIIFVNRSLFFAKKKRKKWAVESGLCIGTDDVHHRVIKNMQFSPLCK